MCGRFLVAKGTTGASRSRDPNTIRPIDFVRVVASVAKRKPIATGSGEQSDRQLSAGASRQTGAELASSTDSDSAHCGSELGVGDVLVAITKQDRSDSCNRWSTARP